MKSEKAKEYLANICKASAMLYEGELEDCDLKLKDVKHAVELAEADMVEKAERAFCVYLCSDRLFPCLGNRKSCKMLKEFKRNMEE